MKIEWKMAGPKVRWAVVPDTEPFDASYVDTWDDLNEDQKREEKERIYREADREGVWGFLIEELKDVLCPHCEGVTHQVWEETDACWSFIGYKSAEEEALASVRIKT